MIYDHALVRTELSRMEEFQRLADNSYEALNVIQKIKEAYQMYGESEDGQYEEFIE